MILSFLDTNFSLESPESEPSCLLCDGEDESDSAAEVVHPFLTVYII